MRTLLRLLLFLGTMLVSGCAANQAALVDGEPTPATVASLPNLGPAPELNNDVWLNVEEPLRLAELRGKVVLLDMWTFG